MADEDDAGEGVEVVRDANFVRVTADACLPFFYGRDLELALFVASAEVLERYDARAEDAPEGALLGRGSMQVRHQWVETARLRMSPNAALSVGLNVLQTLLDHGQIDEPALRAQIEAMISMSGSQSEATH